MARLPMLLSSMVHEARDDRGAEVPAGRDMTRAPKAVERWRKAHAAKRGICAQRCPTHTGRTPGFCERNDGHAGMHGHVFREGMTDKAGLMVYDPTRPWQGCSWDDPPALPSSPRRHKATARGPLDVFTEESP